MDHVWMRQLGPARVAVISEATGLWPMERALEDVPEEVWRREVEADAAGFLPIGFNLVHLALPNASILIDTGFGEYDPTNPDQPIISVSGMRTTPGLPAGLASLGVRPEDVTHVLVSHMHGDHILGATRLVNGRRVPAFPNARYYVMDAEWQSAPAWHQVGAPAIAAQKEALAEANVIELLAGEREIVPGVTYLSAPGESPGHAIVRLAAGGEVLYYLGDLFHYPAEFAHLDWIPRYRDRAALVAARQRYIPRFLAESAWLIPAHHVFPAIGRIARSGEGYCWVASG